MSMINADVRQEIPIRSFSISAYLVRLTESGARYLILKRTSEYLRGSWQQISGRVEAGESAVQAALREIREETGLVPERLYSADNTEVFYEHHQNCINLVPIFVGFVDRDAEVALAPDEHDTFRWITAEEAPYFLPFRGQVAAIAHIEEHFVNHDPNEFLRIVIQG
jgi:dATP pyrophosphohydrolase